MHTNRVRGISRIPYFHMSGASLLGPGILVLLFLASLAYVAFGGTFTLEASPLPEAITAKARVAVMSANAGGAPIKGNLSVSSPQPVDYFPAAYPNRGRDGEGNVMTYEHD